MSNWLDHWWPYVAAGFGVVYAGWRSLRKILRVADVILGYTDTSGVRVPGVAERLDTLEQDVAHVQRLLAIALAAQGIDPNTFDDEVI